MGRILTQGSTLKKNEKNWEIHKVFLFLILKSDLKLSISVLNSIYHK